MEEKETGGKGREKIERLKEENRRNDRETAKG